MSDHIEDTADTFEEEVEFDAAAAFGASAGTEDAPETEGSAEETASEETAETAEETASEDDPEFDVTVGDKSQKAKLSDLRARYAQSAELDQRTQIVAELRAKAEVDSQKATTALTALIERADKAWEPYAKLDFLALSTQMEPADFAQLRQEAQAVLANRQFFGAELEGVQKATVERHNVANQERAAATVRELEDPARGIKGWGPAMYGDVMAYAVSQGMPQAAAQSIVEASSLRILHKAMMADRAAAKAPAVVTKVTAKPTVSLKPGGSKASAGGDSFSSALKTMRERGGGLDATADAFAAHARRA